MKPMLLPRETPDLDNLQYPVYVTPKLDGIRCLFKGGVALSRTLKPIYIPTHRLHLLSRRFRAHLLPRQ